MALSTPFIELTDELTWPDCQRTQRDSVRGFRTTYRHQMAVPVRRGVSWLGAAYAFLGLMTFGALTVVAGLWT